jgi:hypothetical protein
MGIDLGAISTGLATDLLGMFLRKLLSLDDQPIINP